MGIGKKIQELKQDFMLLLLDYYKIYKKEGLMPTNNVLRFTKKFKDETDIYLTFMEEMTEESTEHIHTSTLYHEFKCWYMSNNPKQKIPSNRMFINEIRKHYEITKVWNKNKSSIGIKNIKLIIEQSEEDY
jgi:phage/plasmid-associated DNA primase